VRRCGFRWFPTAEERVYPPLTISLCSVTPKQIIEQEKNHTQHGHFPAMSAGNHGILPFGRLGIVPLHKLDTSYTTSLCDSSFEGDDDDDDDESAEFEELMSRADMDSSSIVGKSLVFDRCKANNNIDAASSSATDYLGPSSGDDSRLQSMTSKIDGIDGSQELKYFHDVVSLSFEFVDEDKSVEGAAMKCDGGSTGCVWPCCFNDGPTDRRSAVPMKRSRQTRAAAAREKRTQRKLQSRK
jgi:hypothetical protein